MAVTATYPHRSYETLEEGRNPYVSIPYEYLSFIILYFLVYEATVPFMKLIFMDTSVPYAFTRFVLNLIHKLLLFAPVFFFRKQVGFFHPLVFLLLLSMAQNIMESPDQLFSFLIIEPVLGKVHVTSGPLSTYNQAELSFLEVKLLLLNILSLIGLYAGYFFSFRWRTFHLPDWQPHRLRKVTLTIILISMAGMVFYVYSRGGLTAHFSTFGMGREKAVGEDGFIHVLINFGFLAALVWFAYDHQAYKNPLFWLALVIVIPNQFILRGSRSSLVFSALLFLLVYIIKTHKIPTARILLMAFIAMMAIGVLGALRKSTFGSKQVNWEILSDVSMTSAFELYLNDTERREGQQPDLTALAKGIKSQGMLWGQTYLGGFLFFVPRTVWPDKPHSIGYYTGTLLYGSAGGKPPGDVIEAYWNFHIAGVLVVFFLYGSLLKWLARMLQTNQGNIAFYIIFILTVFHFRPSNLGLIKCFQQLLPMLLILWMVGAIPPRLSFNNFKRIR